MSNLRLAVALRNARADAITTFIGGSAILKIFSGTQPATGGSETTLLAQLTCNATFAPAASGGVLTLNGITAASSAAATGTATWFRIYKSNGTTHCLDGDVSTLAAATGDLQLDNTGIVLGGTVALGGPNTFTEANA